jgi:hypothetical protein
MQNSMPLKRLHICIFNHNEYFGISDQIIVLKEILKDYCLVTVSNLLVKGVDNLLIECFNAYQCMDLYKFKANNDGYKIFVLLTEHFRLNENNTLYLNDQAWNEQRDYIPDLYQRFIHIVELSCIVDAFVVLCGLPKKDDIRGIFPSKSIFNLCPPKKLLLDYETGSTKLYDFCFFGTLTEHRKHVLNKIKTKFKVFFTTGISNEQRSEIIQQSRFMLNIPQNENWSNISPMRIITAAIDGVWTINISNIKSEFPYASSITLPELIKLNIDSLSSIIQRDSINKQFDNESDIEQFARWVS